ncbi:hypothetical protein [Sphingomonas sp. KR3-1]|uniref:hypothetical protein n=1 Tax=Sphingomonas sp. KR3-1 TaxID=3156611 RepID=UPI0032B583BD
MEIAHEIELCRRAIAIGEELIRVAESVGQPLAAVHIGTGIDILSAHVDLAEMVSTSPDMRGAIDRLSE